MILGKQLMGEPFELSDDARARHIHVVGQTGTGKSALLLNMIRQTMEAGHGVAVIDPHRELAEAALTMVPPWRVNTQPSGSFALRYLNPADENPIPFNPLHGIALGDRPRVADEVISAFRAVWGWSPESAPRALPLLRHAVRTALDLPAPTFLDVMDIVLGMKSRKTTDPMTAKYWAWLESKEKKFQDEAVSPVYTRLDTLLGSPDIRATLCQRPSFDLQNVMDNQQILICNLNKGKLGELNSHLIGAFIVSGIVQAAMSRQFHQRTFYLFVDEFQNFATDSFSTALSEARKWGLSLTLAHQYTQQIPPNLLASVIGNTGTTIAFRVGAEDAQVLAGQFGLHSPVNSPDPATHDPAIRDFCEKGLHSPTPLTQQPNFHAWARVLRGGSPQALRIETLPPPAPVHDRVDRLVKNSRTRFGRSRALAEAAITQFQKPRKRKVKPWN